MNSYHHQLQHSIPHLQLISNLPYLKQTHTQPTNTMHFTTTTLALLASITSASPLIPRQGSFYYAFGLKYSGGGCTDQSLIYADPIYTKNGCAPLTRPAPYEPQPPITPVVSYKLTSVCAGGSGKSIGSYESNREKRG